MNFVRGMLDCEVRIYSKHIGEDGNAECVACFKGQCFFQEGGRELIERDGRSVRIAGRLLIEGDVAPGVDFIGAGSVRIFFADGETRCMRIFEARRGRGLDGDVSHTAMRLY